MGFYFEVDGFPEIWVSPCEPEKAVRCGIWELDDYELSIIGTTSRHGVLAKNLARGFTLTPDEIDKIDDSGPIIRGRAWIEYAADRYPLEIVEVEIFERGRPKLTEMIG